MGLFDSIIGTAQTPTDPTPTGTNPGDPTQKDPAPPADSNPTAVILPEVTNVDGSAVAQQIESPIEFNFDIGGDIMDSNATEYNPVIISSEIIAPETPVTNEILTTSESTTLTDISILDTVPTITLVDEKKENLDRVDTISTTETLTPVESLDAKITEFLKELEGLKANDQMLLQEKESAIEQIGLEMKSTLEKLEAEKKALEEEVKTIEADEKKIDNAIASLSGTTKTK